MEYLVVIAPTERGFSAYAPDFEGCVASGRTREQVERQIRAVIEFQCATLRLAGAEAPAPNAGHLYLDVLGGRIGEDPAGAGSDEGDESEADRDRADRQEHDLGDRAQLVSERSPRRGDTG